MAGHNERRTIIMYTDEQCGLAGLSRSHQGVSCIAYTEMKLMTAGDLAIGRDLQVVETERSTRPRGHGLPASLTKTPARLIVI